MLKMAISFAVAALMFVATSPASAGQPLLINMEAANQFVQAEIQANGLNWHVNDKTVHKIDGGFILKGTMTTFVREDSAEGFWVQQDVDLGFVGKQKIEILFDKATGATKKVLVDGQEQEVPKNDKMEVVEMKEAQITVAAGTFKAIYMKVKNTESGEEQEAWVNPKEIPVTGMLKTIAPSPLGKMTLELQSFAFAK